MYFNKILIANRGEIALRVIRACKELGIKSVAVYSTADRNSLHVKYADEAYCIGPHSPSESYLSTHRIMTIAEISGTDAVHPGAGFLSESPELAEVCEEYHITFIGPSIDNLLVMGDKAQARYEMRKAKLNLVPGSQQQNKKSRRREGIIENEEKAIELAEEIGYPVVVKAVSGGGGRGIRIAHDNASLVSVFRTAQSEAETAFGNPELYLEKLIDNARHIEFQILADKYGNVVHLGERECSIQRRNQKLIEEAPAPSISPEMRSKMGKDAVRAARAIDYINAGTIEFLVDQNYNYYFIEMNTRIQIEHTVTEMITGIDLIKEQIRIAAGERLGFSQDDISFSGHAVECRINAEDADTGFSPDAGKITAYHPPGGPGIRVDGLVYADYEIPPYYDSMLAKLIAYGRNRDESIERMKRALDEFVIEGVKTTIPFHRKVMEDERFINGNFYTNYLSSIEA